MYSEYNLIYVQFLYVYYVQKWYIYYILNKSNISGIVYFKKLKYTIPTIYC